MSALFPALGLALLLLGGHWLVSGADGLARRLTLAALLLIRARRIGRTAAALFVLAYAAYVAIGAQY